ncbi:MerR family DNA-binding transcriptional regulator [Paenibacillus lentus]
MSYRIGEMARILGTSEHTLRYYEKHKCGHIK